jgi:hypothetical protein
MTRQQAQYAVARAFVAGYRAASKCKRCGESDPVVLDFHHVDGTKEVDLSTAVRNRWSAARMLAEIRKTIVLCANCHRRAHDELRRGVQHGSEAAAPHGRRT